MRHKTPEGDLSGFLDVGIEVKGEIAFRDTLRIDGKFEGSIREGKMLVIGESADVNANIHVGTISVSGHLRGSVHASERVELLSTARVECDLDTDVLVVEEGAVFEGQCSMAKEKSGPREVKSVVDLKTLAHSE